MLLYCSVDVKEMRDIKVAQHRIALDLFHEIRQKVKFKLHCQCILDAVQLVAETISNLQRVEVVLSQSAETSKDEVEKFHKSVFGHVCELMKQVKYWLPVILPVYIPSKQSDTRELAVSMML